MKYLFDVNALVALGFIGHEFHNRVAAWVQVQQSLVVATCSITELGFVRVLAQAPAYGFTIAQTQTFLLRLKKARALPFAFPPDHHEVSHLPAWVKAPRRITDGHLVQLARANGIALATLDERIPGAHLIPPSR